MKDFLIQFLDETAQQAGLPPDSMMSKSIKDNLTIKQPRLEYEFSPNKIKRSGRILGITRTKTIQTIKRELYTIEQDVKLTLFCESEEYRRDFCNNFMEYLPKNTNDHKGNFVKIVYGNFEYIDKASQRIGESVISVDKSFDANLSMSFYSRFCHEHTENLIQSITIKEPIIK